MVSQALEGLREHEKLDQVFKKLGDVFVLQHSPCCPNQSWYNTGQKDTEQFSNKHQNDPI